MEKVLKSFLILALVGALAFGGSMLYDLYTEKNQTEEETYTRITVSRGNLTQEVISTGALSIEESMQVTVPYAVIMDRVLVQPGQKIKIGDQLALIDADSVNDAIAQLNTDISTVDESLAALANSYKTNQSVQNPAEGRVKIIYANVGDSAQDVVDAHGGLYVLSLNGKMRVTLPDESRVIAGETVSVTNGEKKWTGTVSTIRDGQITVTFSDASITPGGEVSVLKNGFLLGSAQCEIDMPLTVSTLLDGTISAISMTLNNTYSVRQSVLTVSNVSSTKEFQDLQQQRQDLIQELALVRALREKPYLTADVDGMIQDVAVSSGANVNKGDVLFTVYVGAPDQMVINVDELDITKLAAGQEATVVMDALTDRTYPATVEYISELGTPSGGITNYQVTMKVQGDEQLKLGMNGTVTISVGTQKDVLLVPLNALQSDTNGSYVWLYSPDDQATREAPGIKTYVTTGLSDANYAAVTNGLQEGSQILVVRSLSMESSTGSQTMQDVDMMIPGDVQQMPGDMNMPDGQQDRDFDRSDRNNRN